MKSTLFSSNLKDIKQLIKTSKQSNVVKKTVN